MNKKRFLLSILTVIFASTLSFAEARKNIGFQFALGGTIPIYGDSIQMNNHSQMTQQRYGRFIMGGDVGMTIKLVDPLYMVFDFETCADFGWASNYYSNSIDYAFCLGFQFYPNIGNLSFIVSYAIGARSDFINLPDTYQSLAATKWGNGFKIAAEYDFFAGGGIIPVVGVSYRMMPRGYHNFDNILNLYFRLAFR